jgi:hypothetical protein
LAASLLAAVRSPQWVRGFSHALLALGFPEVARKSRTVAGLLGEEASGGYRCAQHLIAQTGGFPSRAALQALAERMAAGGGDLEDPRE